jgi:steroid delta-isomerase-like uncharacterized protein
VSIEQSKAIVRRLVREVWQNASEAAIDELLADDFVFNYPSPGASSDREGYKRAIMEPSTSFSDIQFTMEDMVAEGDKVAVHWTGTATHTREFFGFAPTGKRVTLAGISIMQIADGRVIREVGDINTLDVLQQIGVFPTSS